MKSMQFRLIFAGLGLPLMILVSTAASADDKTTGATPATAAAAEATTAPAAADETKPGRLRFRSADGTCACTCAKGGMSEADVRRAEELRANARN